MRSLFYNSKLKNVTIGMLSNKALGNTQILRVAVASVTILFQLS